MKKITITLTFIFITLFSFGQVPANNSEKEIFIENQALRIELGNYITYVKSFSTKFKTKNRLIMVDIQRFKTYDIFKLDCITQRQQINEFNPSYYTMIDSIPVLFHSGIENYITPDSVFQKFIEMNFWKTLPKNIDNTIQQKATLDNEFVSSLPDSIKVWDKKLKKTIKVATKGAKVSHFSNSEILFKPKSWTLTFNAGRLENKTEDTY